MSRNTNTLKALEPYWEAIQAGAPRAERNLDELQPTSTRLTTDPAVTDEHNLDRCVRLIANEIIRLHALVTKYDYPVGGETVQGDERHTAERWTNEHAEPGCTSCGRDTMLIWAPVYKNNLCRWCHNFQYTEGHLPTPTLISIHDRGDRMTKAIVELELRPVREAAKKLAGSAKGRRKTKPGKQASA